MTQTQGGNPRNLVAVVVTYNRLSALKKTLTRLLAEDPTELAAIVLVDNASDDGTQAWLETFDNPRLVIYRMGQNGGGAGGFAAGLELAQRQFDPDWFVLMDDDARPEPGALAAFHALPEDKWDAVAAAVYFPDGRICEMNRPSRNPFWHCAEFLATMARGRGGFHLRPSAYSEPKGVAIDVTSFVGFFASRRAVELIGLPDPGLFLYGDDGLYTLSLSASGGRIGFEPGVRFEHACSTFANAQRGRFQPLWKVYYYHRNLLLLYRMAAGWLFWPALLIILPKWLWKVRHHGGQSRLYLRLLAWAVRDGLARRTSAFHSTVLSWANET